MSLYDVVAAVPDPELRVLNLADLGILRDVRQDGPTVTVTITPTYSGCPAMDTIREDITSALHAAGAADVRIDTVLDPPWSTDRITAEGRAKLSAAGIAPPGPALGSALLQITLRCPRCGSLATEQLSRFGSTACKSLWRCRSCQEPFDAVKPL